MIRSGNKRHHGRKVSIGCQISVDFFFDRKIFRKNLGGILVTNAAFLTVFHFRGLALLWRTLMSEVHRIGILGFQQELLGLSAFLGYCLNPLVIGLLQPVRWTLACLPRGFRCVLLLWCGGWIQGCRLLSGWVGSIRLFFLPQLCLGIDSNQREGDEKCDS